jgi:hypothetical protein
MSPRLEGTAEFDQPHDSEEVAIQLVVSEEFAGISISELPSRRGTRNGHGSTGRERVRSRFLANFRVRRTEEGRSCGNRRPWKG